MPPFPEGFQVAPRLYLVFPTTQDKLREFIHLPSVTLSGSTEMLHISYLLSVPDPEEAVLGVLDTVKGSREGWWWQQM